MVSGIPHVIRGLRQLREAGVTAETITAALSVWVSDRSTLTVCQYIDPNA